MNHQVDKQVLLKDLEILLPKINLSRLNIKDLKALHEVMTTPSILVQILAKTTRNKLTGNLLKKPLGELLNVKMDEGGLFGLGILRLSQSPSLEQVGQTQTTS